MFLPGAGHILVGRKRRGRCWFVVWLGLTLLSLLCLFVPPLIAGLIVLVPLQLICTLALWIDAYRCASRSQNPLLSGPAVRYAAGVITLIAAAVIGPSALAAYLVRTYLVEAFWIPTRGMSPTIMPGDRILLHKTRPYQRWSIVVFNPPAPNPGPYVFRIAGLPGETVEIKDDQVHINGSPIPSPPGIGPYESTDVNGRPFRKPGGNPMTLGSDEYFMLGDNSPIAGDSRYIGPIPRSGILGPATAIYWPPSRWRRLD